MSLELKQNVNINHGMGQPITISGLQKIRVELDDRKNNTRPKIVQGLLKQGLMDLKENAEYHAAKEEQGLNERRIKELETTIATANVIDVTKLKKDDKVISFGATITVKDLETDKESKYKIVGKDEAVT